MPRLTVEQDIDVCEFLSRVDDTDLLDELKDRGIALDEFDDYELIEEIEARGITISENTDELITSIYHKRRLGKDYESELDQLLYHVTGRAI